MWKYLFIENSYKEKYTPIEKPVDDSGKNIINGTIRK